MSGRGGDVEPERNRRRCLGPCDDSTQQPTNPPCGWAREEPPSATTVSGKAPRRRASLAGIHGFHPHKLRHTAAHRWLAAGGSESGLMAMAGWTRTDMLVRYTRATAAERAAQEARRLNLGDLDTGSNSI